MSRTGDYTRMCATPKPYNKKDWILRTMGNNYMSYTLGLVIIALMVVGGLVFVADLVVDIVTLVDVGDTKDLVKDVKGHVKDVCEDGNMCTEDRKVSGGCVSRPKPNGTPCESSCYKPETDPTETHVCQMPRKCKDCVECVGTECAGTCAVDGDCPVLTSSEVALGNATAACVQSSCISSLDVAGLYPELTEECDSSAKLFVDACVSLLESTQPTVVDGCLNAYPSCVNGTLDSCLYFFNCAPLSPTIVV